jgi:hypothetical protein
MRVLALGLLLATGCSFVLVKGPSERIDMLPQGVTHIDCAESSLVPLVDTVAGVAAISAAGVGILVEQTSDDGKPENFTKYYAGPLAVAAIVYLVSASRGNTRVTWCSDANDRLRKPDERVVPITPDPKQPSQQDDRENPL